MEPVRLELGKKLFEGMDVMIQQNFGVQSTFRYHTHRDFYEFFFVTSGRALHLVNGMSQVISRGSLVFVRPSDMHSYDYYKKDDFVFFNAGISIPQFERIVAFYEVDRAFFDAPVLPRHVHLDGDAAEHFTSLLTSLKDMADGLVREHLFRKVVSEVVYFMLSGPSAEELTDLPSWLMKLLQEMERPENFVAGLPRLLELANYSQSYVNRAFQHFLYTTPTRYINDLRLRQAYHWLTATEMPILNIATSCGFNSISHFYSCFRQKFDICPSQFRRGNAPQAGRQR